MPWEWYGEDPCDYYARGMEKMNHFRNVRAKMDQDLEEQKNNPNRGR